MWSNLIDRTQRDTATPRHELYSVATVPCDVCAVVQSSVVVAGGEAEGGLRAEGLGQLPSPLLKLWAAKIVGKSPFLSKNCRPKCKIVSCYQTQVNAPHLNPGQIGRYSVYVPRRDGRLSEWTCVATVPCDVCAVLLSQYVGCYTESEACSGDNSCRLTDYAEPSNPAPAQHEIEQCAAACRTENSVYFAKTVRLSVYQLIRGVITGGRGGGSFGPRRDDWKCRTWILTDVKFMDQVSSHEIDGHEMDPQNLWFWFFSL